MESLHREGPLWGVDSKSILNEAQGESVTYLELGGQEANEPSFSSLEPSETKAPFHLTAHPNPIKTTVRQKPGGAE